MLLKILSRSLLFLIIASFSFSGHAQKIDTEIYEVKAGETFLDVAKKFFSSRKHRYQNVDDYVADLRRWNPSLRNRVKLGTGTQLYVDFPYSPFVSNNYAPKLRSTSDYEVKSKVDNFKVSDAFRLGIAFTASQGDFFESIDSVADVDFQQNSPVSLGLGGSYFFPNSKFSLGYSAYWSHLRASTTNIGVNEVDLEPEIGANLYGQYRLGESNWGIYGGVDYEQFSTFNLEDFINIGADFTILQNRIVFGTAGLYRNFSFFSKPASIKVSVSRSVSSSIDQKLQSNTETFSGNRFLVFYSHLIWKRFWYHILYKQHNLEGPTNLTIRRIGVGFGWALF